MYRLIKNQTRILQAIHDLLSLFFLQTSEELRKSSVFTRGIQSVIINSTITKRWFVFLGSSYNMLKFLSCSFQSQSKLGFGFSVRSHMALTGISIRKPSNNKRILYVNRGQTMTLTKNLIGMQSHHYSSLDQAHTRLVSDPIQYCTVYF